MIIWLASSKQGSKQTSIYSFIPPLFVRNSSTKSFYPIHTGEIFAYCTCRILTLQVSNRDYPLRGCRNRVALDDLSKQISISTTWELPIDEVSNGSYMLCTWLVASAFVHQWQVWTDAVESERCSHVPSFDFQSLFRRIRSKSYTGTCSRAMTSVEVAE